MKSSDLLGEERVYGDPLLVDPPVPLPKMRVSLPWTKVSDSYWNRGTLTWKVTDSVVHVSDESGKEIGSVEACFGGLLEVHINREDGFEIWRLDPQDVWYALAGKVQGAQAAEKFAPKTEGR